MTLKSLLRTLPLYPTVVSAYWRARVAVPAAARKTAASAHSASLSLGLRHPTAFEMSERYDRELIQMMRKVLGRDSVCVDVGAHVGTILAKMFEVAPGGRHFAFEPIPSLALSLSERFPLARVHGCALSDEAGVADFHHLLNAAAESGLRRTATHAQNPRVEVIRVEVRRLDDVIPTGERVALIKIDAEGAEVPIMRGGQKTILRCRPLIVFEAGSNTTPAFGVTTDDVYDMITSQLGMRLSTMRRWMKGRPPFTREQFRQASYIDGKPFHGLPFFDFYFLAY